MGGHVPGELSGPQLCITHCPQTAQLTEHPYGSQQPPGAETTATVLGISCECQQPRNTSA